MKTNLEHYYDRISNLNLCEITENVMAEDIGNKDYCDEQIDCRECLLDTIKWLNEEYKPKLEGGCGATSGYAQSKDEAIKKWNGGK